MENRITIGMDLGDRSHHVCVLVGAGEGEQVESFTIPNTREAVSKLFQTYPGARVAMETGTHSRWISGAAQQFGMEVLVGNARKLRAIWASTHKSDVRDANLLARMARFDPGLLAPIQHRGERVQQDLAQVKARDQLVRVRTTLINHVRGTVKAFGHRVPRCSAGAFHHRATLPEVLEAALRPIVEQIGELTRRIRSYDRQLDQRAQAYPEVQGLTQVTGVGTLTALAYVVTLEDVHRFDNSRDVGPYLGLVPRRDQSGQSDRQLRITKAGDEYLRRLLVGSAHYILGPFGPDCDLRRHGERILASGGKNAKKRAAVAVARKLAVLLHALWRTGEVYEPNRQLRHAA